MGATKKQLLEMKENDTTPTAPVKRATAKRVKTTTGSKLARAVIKVMQEVKGMEKNSTVGTGRNSYNGTKDQDVKEVFNDALAKNGLCILPIGLEESTDINRWTESTQYGEKQKQSVFTKVATKYLLLHESGESQELYGYGHGVDSQDKSAGKATTYALKNCLLYTFLTPVGKIDDTDTTHSSEIPTPPKFTADDAKKCLDEGLSIEEVQKRHELTPAQKEKYINLINK